MNKLEIVCKVCKKAFIPTKSRKILCSKQCVGKNAGSAKKVNFDHVYEDAFWEKVKKSNGCWEWQGKLNNTGYGLCVFSKNKKIGAHRAAWMFHSKNSISSDLFVCHKCDNPRCVKPDHLFLGDHLANNVDKELKGRGNHAKEGFNGNAALNVNDVLTIRELWATGQKGVKDLADLFSVKTAQIYRIIHGKSWVTVPMRMEA